MLNSEDRRAIEGLFSRLADIERRTPDRDPEAEHLIAREIDRQPGAPYYLAQTVLVQQHALEVAETRIRELEQKLEEASSRTLDRPRGPWERDDRGAQDECDDRGSRRGFGGGGFLAGAAQTAMGVAGGVLLGSAIGSLFGAGSAQAAESPASDAEQNTDADAGTDSADSFDAGSDNDFGDMGGDGGFDMGGDF